MKPMRTWEMAKLLIEHCDSQQDVDQVIETLNDRLAMQEVRRILAAFATRPRLNVPTPTPSSRPIPTLRKSERQIVDDGVKALPDTSRAVMAEQLEVLFRACGMTNRQVEQWFTVNFGIEILIGKGSLRRYLMRVLTGVDLGLANRILATVQGRLTGDSLKKSDIEDYWDRLDNQFSNVP